MDSIFCVHNALLFRGDLARVRHPKSANIFFKVSNSMFLSFSTMQRLVYLPLSPSFAIGWLYSQASSMPAGGQGKAPPF
jgi:hypothetical protein